MDRTILTDARTMSFVATTNLEAAKQFYADTLRLTLLHDDEYGSMFVVYQKMLLRVQRVATFVPQPFTVLGWKVADIAAAVADLDGRGVRFEKFGFPTQDAQGICSFPNGDKVAWFKDLDGNTLSIAQIAGV